MFEYACHEDNSAIRNFIEASRFERRQRVSANTMTKPGDPTKPTGDERDRALARLEKALRKRCSQRSAESTIEDQRQRLKLLGTGREETMRALAEARAELSA